MFYVVGFTNLLLVTEHENSQCDCDYDCFEFIAIRVSRIYEMYLVVMLLHFFFPCLDDFRLKEVKFFIDCGSVGWNWPLFQHI